MSQFAVGMASMVAAFGLPNGWEAPHCCAGPQQGSEGSTADRVPRGPGPAISFEISPSQLTGVPAPTPLFVDTLNNSALSWLPCFFAGPPARQQSNEAEIHRRKTNSPEINQRSLALACYDYEISYEHAKVD